MRYVVLAATACLSLSGCAVFQPNPSETACEQASVQLGNAQAAVAAADIALAIAQAVVNKPDAIAKAQNALAAAQAGVSSIEALYAVKCKSPPPVLPPAAPT